MKVGCTSIAAYARGPGLVLVPNLADEVKTIRFPDDWGYVTLLWQKFNSQQILKKKICAVHALSLHLCSGLAKKPLNNTLELLYTSNEDFSEKKAAQSCITQLPRRNWNATGSLFQCLGAPCIIHFARCTVSSVRWTASRMIQRLSDDLIIHFTLTLTTSSLKAARCQKQCKVYKLGPTPYLWN